MEAVRSCPDKTQFKKPEAFGTNKRYHTTTEVAAKRIQAHTDHQARDHECLHITVFGITCTFGTENMISAVLVSGSMSRPVQTIT